MAGPGNGYIDIFNFDGDLLLRFASQGVLNSPWGLTIYGKHLLVGNFGDGRVNAFSLKSREFKGSLQKQVPGGKIPVVIDGLWSILNVECTLFFAAGLDAENHGLFGKLVSLDK